MHTEERAPSKDELDFIKNQTLNPNVGNATSDDRNILDRKELSKLRSRIQLRLEEFFHNTLMASHQCTLKITQSWCNYSKDGDYHHQHSHSNSAISGVYYPQAEHPDDRIEFYSPLEPYRGMTFAVLDDNMLNASSWWLPVKTGTLFLFPSYLIHSVPILSNRETPRISLSFNTFYAGELGYDKKLTKLVIMD